MKPVVAKAATGFFILHREKEITMDEGMTTSGQPMKTSQKQIVTGMDKLRNPEGYDTVDQIFDSSTARDINEGSADMSGGIDYKGLKK